VSKKLQEKQRRRLAEEQKKAQQRRAQRRRNLVTTAIAIVVAAGVVWLVLSDTSGDGGNDAVGDLKNGVSVEEAGCEDVQTFEPQEATHIAEGSEHDDYNSNPPTSGPHYAQPLGPIATGFYPSEIEAEKVIHNLEHGEIVIWYSPDAPEETVDAIETLTKQEPQATVAVQWTDIEAPYQFVLTAWGSLQRCVQPSQEVVDDFRRDFQGNGPERIAPPFEG
jgi:hypothetical protein